MTKCNKTYSKVIVIILIVSMFFSGCINRDKFETDSIINNTSNISINPIATVISTPEITPTPAPEVTPTLEVIHTIEIIDETMVWKEERPKNPMEDNIYTKQKIVGIHQDAINNILNHTDSNITQSINKIKVYDNIDELNLYCNNKMFFKLIACTDGKEINVIKANYYGTIISTNYIRYGVENTISIGNFNETLIHMIGYVKGINLYDNNSKAFADEYLDEKYTAEFGKS